MENRLEEQKMDWESFRIHIPMAHTCSCWSKQEIGIVLADMADVEVVRGRHKFYPCSSKGVSLKHGDDCRGFMYVDQAQSYCGDQPVFCSEASSCVLMILTDTLSPMHFVTHIDAALEPGHSNYEAVLSNLKNFFKHVGHDMGRPNLFVFTGDYEGTKYELDNMVSFLHAANLSVPELKWLAMSTYYITGNNKEMWNPYCAVRVRQKPHSRANILDVIFSVPE